MALAAGEPMSRTPRTFTKEFKQQAVNLANQMDASRKAASQLGINESQIREWKKRLATEKSIKAIEPTFSVEEFQRLQKENEKQKKVIQILKSAAAFFLGTI
jgi:transposase-like protein